MLNLTFLSALTFKIVYNFGNVILLSNIILFLYDKFTTKKKNFNGSYYKNIPKFRVE